MVRAHDPAVKTLPPELAASLRLTDSPLQAVMGASALVVATQWPEYREVAADQVKALMTRPLVLDASRFLDAMLGTTAGIEYVSVGRAFA
jgi:UDPglucose 6-dehydrogenase